MLCLLMNLGFAGSGATAPVGGYDIFHYYANF